MSPPPHDAEHVVKGLQSDMVAFPENKPKKTIVGIKSPGILRANPHKNQTKSNFFGKA